MDSSFREGEFHRLLARTHRLHIKRTSAQFAPLGITYGQPRVLNYLYGHDGCIQRDIATSCELEAATVTELLAPMEKSGLARRESDPDDRRALRVFITPKGKLINGQLQAVFHSVEAECFAGFDERERATLFALLSRVYDNLKAGEASVHHA